MIREIITEWRPTTITMPLNGNRNTHNSKRDGLLDHNVVARVVNVERGRFEEVDENGDPIKIKSLAIEYKVNSERDSHVFVIKPNVKNEYQWARRRFALQFQELEGKTLGTGFTGTPLLNAEINGQKVVPEGIVAAFLREGVTTIEALAYLSDENIGKFGPGMSQWRTRAQDFLNNKELGAAPDIPEPKRVGRPRKEAEAA